VKFILKHNSRLGEVWKLSGNTSELGNWVPEVSPTLFWREGGVWSAEVALPPGQYSFKCMLRTADGSYVWESGDNRTITVRLLARRKGGGGGGHRADSAGWRLDLWGQGQQHAEQRDTKAAGRVRSWGQQRQPA
jgi:hypothetical protein